MLLTFFAGNLSIWLALWATLSHAPAVLALGGWLMGLAATIRLGRLVAPRFADFPQDLSAYWLALPLASLAALTNQALLSFGFIVDVQLRFRQGLPLTYSLAAALGVTAIALAGIWARSSARLAVLMIVAFLPGWCLGARLLDLPFRAASLPVLMRAFGQ